MKNSVVRLGVLGAGFIGRVHLRCFSDIENLELAGLFDVDKELAEKAAEEYQVEKVYDSADAIFEDTDIDAVVLGVPNKLHKPLAVQALKAGKHVLLEKPMALNGTEAAEIYQAQQQSGKQLMMAHQMRWTWTNREIKKIIQTGALGEIYNVKVGWFRRKGIPGWGSWFTRMSESGGGPLIDIGVHMLDLSIFLMGNPKPVSVYGSTYAEFGPRRQGLGTWGTPQWDGFYDVEDLATALIKMDNGSTLSLDVSWAAHTDKSNDIFLKIFGTEGGVVVYNNNEATLCGEKFERPCNIEIIPPENSEDARIALSQHFVDSIRANTPPIADALSGLVNSTIIDAIYQSAQTGKSIELNWDNIGTSSGE